MYKQDFLSALRKDLVGLPENDINRSVEFYSEMIDDRIEEGLIEDEATASLGNISDIVSQILSESSLPKVVMAKMKPNRALRTWEIVLLISGAPLWLPLLLAAIIVVLAVYIVIWSIVISIYAVDLSLAAGGLAGITGLFTYLVHGNLAGGLLIIGAGFVCAGLSILLFLASNQITSGILFLSKKIIQQIKFWFIKKESIQ